MRRMMLAGLLCASSLVACKKEPPPEPEKLAEAPPPEPKKVEKKKKPQVKVPDFAPSNASTKVEGPATAPDFEEEAEKSLHFENLEAELDRLEAEITGG